MKQIVLETTPTPEISVTLTDGDLRLTGWEQNKVQVEGPDDKPLRAEQVEGRIVIEADSDCTVRVPRQARVQVVNVPGEARLKALEGLLTIQDIGGDLTLRQTAETSVENVGGDLSAKKIAGALSVHHAGGDVSVRGVQGDFAAEDVGGDLYLRDVSGHAQAEVGGDLIFGSAFVAEKRYAFEAGGDILCRVTDSAARITAECGGEISVGVPGAQIMGDPSRKTIVLGIAGAPAAEVTLDAGGDIALTPISGDPEAMGDVGDHFGEEFGVMAEEFAARIESQVEAQMADFERQMNQQFTGLNLNLGTGHVNVDKLTARAREAAERANDKIRRKTEAAHKRAEALTEAARRREEAARRRAEHMERHKSKMTFGFKFDAPRPPAPPLPPRPPMPPAAPIDPVSDEERMAILRMVEQKKISIDDAEKLLSALESK